MKKIALIFLLCCAASVISTAFEINPEIQKNYKLALNTSIASASEKFAAMTLSQYLTKVFSGSEFSIIDEKALTSEDKNIIFIGSTNSLSNSRLEPAVMDIEEILIAAKGNCLYLSGGKYRGTLYAVYDFLEKFCGIKYLAFDTVVIPSMDKLAIADTSIKRQPAFKFRIVEPGRNVGAEMQSFNKANSYYVSSDKYGYYQRTGMPRDVHSIAYYSKNFPIDNPELFALLPNGRAVPAKAGQAAALCLSNPLTRDIIWKQMEKYIEEDQKNVERAESPRAEYYDLSLDDLRDVCICPVCKKITDEEGSYAAVVLDAVNDIAGRMKRKDPKLKILTLVYANTLMPPKSIKPADNVIPRICVHDTEMLVDVLAETTLPIDKPGNAAFKKVADQWIKNSTDVAFWDYWNYYSKPAFPYICLDKYFTNMRYYQAAKATSVLVEMEIYNASFYALKYYLALKLMDNPQYQKDLLINSFMSGYYGKAAPALTEYLYYLDGLVATEAAANPLGKRSPFNYNYLSKSFFIKANDILDRAEKAVADDLRSLKHVQFERVALDRGLILFWRKFGAEMPFTKTALLNRIEINQTALINEFFATDKRAQEILELKAYVAGESMEAALPAEFVGKENVFDYNTASFSFVVDTRQVRFVNDADAIGGRAAEIYSKDEFVAKTNSKFHRVPFEAGFYNRLTQEQGPLTTIKEFPTDEKYHLYKIGTWQMVPGCYIFLHWTWQFQFLPTSSYMATKDSPPYDVYASLKFTGPVYVKNSSRPDGVFVDRIILVRQQ